MPLTISAGAATDVGRVRAVNEDSHCLRPRLYAVADGMGGHAAGDRASQIAVEALSRLADRGSFGIADLQQALSAASSAMVEESRAFEGARGMGTTVTGLAIVSVGGTDHWAVFNIGDSRVYQLVGSSLRQLSVDHSEVQEMIAAGRLSPSAAATYPRRNVVTRSLGVPDSPTADTWVLPMEAGQVFLACSDGLTGELDDGAIANLLAGPGTPAEVAGALVTAAVDAGGHDNVTVVVVRTSDDEDTTPRLNVSELRAEIREVPS